MPIFNVPSLGVNGVDDLSTVIEKARSWAKEKNITIVDDIRFVIGENKIKIPSDTEIFEFELIPPEDS